LLSKKAPLSIEMQNAVKADQASINDPENIEDISYVDNEEEEIDPDLKRQRELVENIQTIEDLEFCEGVVTDETLLPVLEAHRKKFEKQAKK
jgi:recombinational DNA repair protein RecT